MKKVLVTGSSGDVGSYLVRYFAQKGFVVRALDLRQGSYSDDVVAPENRFVGSVADDALVDEAVAGSDAVVHLAWSFSDKPAEIFDVDIRGHINLLEAALRRGVKRFIYTSTATVYGRAVRVPVTESHPRLVFEARKPLYALAKSTAEDLCTYYHLEAGLETVIFRFWWAFGETIGGRHLRNMVREALQGKTLVVPAGAGGTFVTMADLARAIELALSSERASGKIYNVGSFYVTWEEIAEMIVEATGSKGGFRAVPLAEWDGPQFLSDNWELGWEEAERDLGYRPANSRSENALALKKAIAAVADALRSEKGLD
ncbi:MAG: NAD-dependent epimerase/dehydratase family protein [Thermacetogeniaceae bacterium]